MCFPHYIIILKSHELNNNGYVILSIKFKSANQIKETGNLNSLVLRDFEVGNKKKVAKNRHIKNVPRQIVFKQKLHHTMHACCHVLLVYRFDVCHTLTSSISKGISPA